MNSNVLYGVDMISSICQFLERRGEFIVIVTALALYIRTAGFDFVELDDGLLIFKNAKTAGMTLQNLKLIFTTFDPELYIPFTLLSYQINYIIAGYSPWIYHLTNVLLYVAACYFVLKCLMYATGNRVLSVIGALLFCIHPLNVETVAWASARKDLLSGLFLFISLYYFLSRDGASKKSLMFFIASLLSKVSGAPLPVFLLLWQRVQHGVSWKVAAKNTWPYFFASAVFGSLAIIGKEGNISLLTLSDQLLLFGKSVAQLAQSIVLPYNTRVLYEASQPIAFGAFSIVVLLLIITTITLVHRKDKTISLYIAGALLLYIPVIATFAKGHNILYASDRYAFIPLLFIIAAGIHCYLRFPVIRKVMCASVGCLALYCLVQSSIVIGTWKNTEHLYRNVLLHEPNSSMALNNLGRHLWKKGEIDEGVALYKQSIEADPSHVLSFINLAVHELSVENRRGAEGLFLKAIDAAKTKPILTMDHLRTYYMYAEFLEQQGDLDGAMQQFTDAAKEGSHIAEAHLNLGIQYHKRRNLPEAYASLITAAALRKNYVPALYQLAAVAGEMGKIDEVVDLLKEVQRIAPGYERTEHHLRKLDVM